MRFHFGILHGGLDSVHLLNDGRLDPVHRLNDGRSALRSALSGRSLRHWQLECLG